MAAPDRVAEQITRVEEEIEKIRIRFFEPQLNALGLGINQIRGQTLDELHQSLESVNDAIRDPSSFGVLRVKITPDAGVVIANSAEESHVQVSALPILLERKRRIVALIAEEGGVQKIENIRDLVSQVSDNGVRETILTQVEELEANARKYDEEVADVQAQQEQAEEELRVQRNATLLQIEAFERKSQVWRSFLERESIASILGAVLLVALALTLVVAMFSGTNPSEVVTNSFLIILGYFFGQTVSRRSPTSA
jgi:hypothetical protein